jgi:hypothetical protein
MLTAVPGLGKNDEADTKQTAVFVWQHSTVIYLLHRLQFWIIQVPEMALK